MISGRSARQTGPNRLEPTFVIFFGNNGKQTCGKRWPSVSSRLAFHQEKFDIVLDNGVWLVWFTKESGSITGGFKSGIFDGNAPELKREEG